MRNRFHAATAAAFPQGTCLSALQTGGEPRIAAPPLRWFTPAEAQALELDASARRLVDLAFSRGPQ